MLPYSDDYAFCIPQGYAPIVISNDCYPRQEGVGFKGWGNTEVAMWQEYKSTVVKDLRKVVRSLVGHYHLLCCWRGEVHNSSQRERYSR